MRVAFFLYETVMKKTGLPGVDAVCFYESQPKVIRINNDKREKPEKKRRRGVCMWCFCTRDVKEKMITEQVAL